MKLEALENIKTVTGFMFSLGGGRNLYSTEFKQFFFCVTGCK